NLLSCTPTLEMGIDIGDLSSLILCSVPPAQANYIQRIGRAGRRDGNALNLTVANARPHDLYFYSEPEEMLAGQIDSPGIFLDASAVLERQFTAFCFDCWVASDDKAALPRKLGDVLNSLEPVDQKKFPHNLIRYIEINQTELFDRFIALFRGKVVLGDDSVKNLKRFVQGDQAGPGSVRYKIMHGLHSRKLERDSLRKKVRTLANKIRNKKKGPKDKNFEKDLRELLIEKTALQALVKNISDRDIFNFLTDEGLIPNYAFPELGVMLNSLIYRKKKKVQEGEGSYDSWVYEYERPAVSAIEELAPANKFYAGKRKVTIDQVDMTVSELETWRFCNNCSHKILVGKEEETETCTSCGSTMWADEGRKRLMLRMRQVFASTRDRESRISDDSDDRDPTFYNKQMLLEFDEKEVLDAYQIEGDTPFGFDFLAKADFCEINFGEKTEIGEKTAIAGVETHRAGFAICRVCGKVQGNNESNNHALTCTAKDKETDKNLINCIYLYRQFTSEAIRILLPVSILSGADRKLHSFVAALQLGLKRMFKGKIDHLQTTIHEEPLPDSSFKRKYLVLYDTVPGGTGYLKQLMRSKEPLLEVLELALELLRSCSCNQQQDKDGCYRCLYAYRNSYTMADTSRNTAVELLAEILRNREKLVKTETLRNINLNALFDSELEARFVKALRRSRTTNLPVLLKKELVNGKPGYFLKVDDRAYYIEPQVRLGELDGVSIPSKVDFLVRPARSKDTIKPIAVFLDGFTYHKDRIGHDLAQRMAIAQSNRYHVWSLTWRDVENCFNKQVNYFENYLDPASLPSGGNLKKLLKGYGLGKFRAVHKLNSFDMFLRFLQAPGEEAWRQYAFVCGLLHADPAIPANEEAIAQWISDVENNFNDEMASFINEADCPCLYGVFISNETGSNTILRKHVITEQQAVSPPVNLLGMRVGCSLNDDQEAKEKEEFQAYWNGFLRLYNLFQFVPYSFFVTTGGINGNAYTGLRFYVEDEADTGIPEKKGEEWKEVYELTDGELHELLNILRDNEWPVPEAGFELVGSEDEIVAAAELAWEKLQLAFLRDEELLYKDQFKGAGWQVFPLSDVVLNPDSYLALYKREGDDK
ncbi:MAG: DUF1998 domain-containing protein, partial [Desulfobulbaceae bacterium]|nr:DUF1998 domain-containing protein [Desulfobulbaceae bacterium]